MIGVFDSGVGGLTVVNALSKALPDCDITYFGDSARTPYGNKSPATIIDCSVRNTEFLLDQGARVIVIACNTASSVASDTLKNKFSVPVFEVISPGAQMAAEVSRTCRFGVIGTRSTVNSGVYEEKIKAIKPMARVFSVACPMFVPLVEEGWIKRPETAMIVKKYLHPLKTRQIDTLILGCTHYPVLKNQIQRKIGNRVNLVDSSIAVSAQVKSFFRDHPEMDIKMSRNGSIRFCVSDSTDQFKRISEYILKRRVTIEHVRI